MSKQAYKFSRWTMLAGHIASWLPNRIRAWVYLDTLDSLDEHLVAIEDHHPDRHSEGSYTLQDVVSSVRLETLRREVMKDGLKGKLIEIDTPDAQPKEER